ncbi:helix-turn-helix transcriptional regulator [Streptomyces sp. NPDC048290]|uniref:helix-turn-helix domain-containing protein n=1 Tax=Streptomyces sp. NPDC048290 TaxID=3155811 RepID=UPI00341D26D9
MGDTLVNRKELNPEGGPEAAFGARLRSMREARGWTQDELALLMGYSGRHISGVETGRKPPTRRFSLSADAVFELDASDTFERAWREIEHGSLLQGFPEYVGYEGRATEIRVYEVGAIPGLLQTPEYAQVLADGAVHRGAITREQASERVAVVAERQAALARKKPPLILVVLDESCIRRPIGGPEAVDEQMQRLAEFAEQPTTTLQIAPFTMGWKRPFDLPLYILTMPDRSLMMYSESAQRGYLEREGSAVLPMLTAYHQLQTEALSQSASLDLINQLRKDAL